MRSKLSLFALVLLASSLLALGFPGRAAAQAQNAAPAGMPADLWRIITTRDGFIVYEGRMAHLAMAGQDANPQGTTPVAESGNPPAATGAMPADLWRIITTRDGFDVYGNR